MTRDYLRTRHIDDKTRPDPAQRQAFDEVMHRGDKQLPTAYALRLRYQQKPRRYNTLHVKD